MQQLMSAMGIGKKSLYDTFGCKRQLFITALQHYADQSVQLFQQKLQDHGGGLQAVKSLLTALRDMSQQQSVKGCMLSVNMADFFKTITT